MSFWEFSLLFSPFLSLSLSHIATKNAGKAGMSGLDRFDAFRTSLSMLKRPSFFFLFFFPFLFRSEPKHSSCSSGLTTATRAHSEEFWMRLHLGLRQSCTTHHHHTRQLDQPLRTSSPICIRPCSIAASKLRQVLL